MYSQITSIYLDIKKTLFKSQKLADYEKKLNGLLKRKDWRNANKFITWLNNRDWHVSIYHSAKEKQEIKELKNNLDEDNWKVSFAQIITPRK